MAVMDGYDTSPSRTIITPASFDKLLAPLVPPITSTHLRTLPPIDQLVRADTRRSPPRTFPLIVKSEPLDRIDFAQGSYPRPILPPLGQPPRSTSATSASSIISSPFPTNERPHFSSHSSSGLSAASVSAGIITDSRSSSPYGRDKTTTLAPLPFVRPLAAPFALGPDFASPYAREEPRRFPLLFSPPPHDPRLYFQHQRYPQPNMRNGATASEAEAVVQRETRSTRKRKEPEDRDDEESRKQAPKALDLATSSAPSEPVATSNEAPKFEAAPSTTRDNVDPALAAIAAVRENGQEDAAYWSDKGGADLQGYEAGSASADRAGPSGFAAYGSNGNVEHDILRSQFSEGGGYTLANAEAPSHHRRQVSGSQMSDDGQSRTPSHGNADSAAVSSFIANLPPDTRNALESGSQPYSRSPELRVSHKLAERKRRKEMKDLFDELRDHLPADRGMKASKWEILSRAVDFISHIKRTNVEMVREIEGLRREVDGLKAAAYAGATGQSYTDAAGANAAAAGYPSASGYGGPSTYPPPSASTSYATGVHASLPQSNTRGGPAT